MNSWNSDHYRYTFFTNVQLFLLKVTAPWFDKLVILDPIGVDRVAIDMAKKSLKGRFIVRDDTYLQAYDGAGIRNKPILCSFVGVSPLYKEEVKESR